MKINLKRCMYVCMYVCMSQCYEKLGWKEKTFIFAGGISIFGILGKKICNNISHKNATEKAIELA